MVKTAALLSTSSLFPYTTLFRSYCTKATQLILRLVPQVTTPACSGVVERHLSRAAQSRASHRWSPRYHRSEEHTSELQSRRELVCRLLLEKKKVGGKSSR